MNQSKPWRRADSIFLALLWASGLALLPIYLAPSGTPQVSHFVFAAAAAAVFIARGFRILPHLRSTSRSLAWFVGYAVALNATWALATGDDSFLLSALFYTFDYLVFRTGLALYSHYRQSFLRLSLWTSIVTLAVLAVATATTEQTGAFRSAAFFNNPNQLAYYTVLIATLATLGFQYLRVSPVWHALLWPSALYLSTVANSKAGYAALAALFVIALIRRPMIAVAVALAVTAAIQLSPVAEQQADNAVARIADVQSDDSLAARGYLLLVENPEYLALGAGEGDIGSRFHLGHEIHSTWATLLFAYGLPGTLFFGAFLVRLLRHTQFATAIYLAPVAVYGIAHQGLRFTMLWVLLAFVTSLSKPKSVQTDA